MKSLGGATRGQPPARIAEARRVRKGAGSVSGRPPRATEQRLVREAIGLLDRTKLISTVLNNVQRTGIGDDPMSYGYGYGYGSQRS